MPTYKLTLEYVGTEFNGWAIQPGHRTVEGVLAHAIETVLSEPVKITAAGRTDTGVHALGQVVSFDSAREAEPERLVASFNGLLSHDISVLGAERAADGFDARADALWRSYRYRIVTRRTPSPFERHRALWLTHPIDQEAIEACAAALVGTHDFTAFTPTQTKHVRFDRVISIAEWGREGELLEFRIQAGTFMRHMVRVIVGTMLDVGAGRMTVDQFTALLAGAPRADAGATAEPHGLYLTAVGYE